VGRVLKRVEGRVLKRVVKRVLRRVVERPGGGLWRVPIKSTS